jgi:hypothetical protein
LTHPRPARAPMHTVLRCGAIRCEKIVESPPHKGCGAMFFGSVSVEFLSAVRRASRAIRWERTSTGLSHRRLNRWPPGGGGLGWQRMECRHRAQERAILGLTEIGLFRFRILFA